MHYIVSYNTIYKINSFVIIKTEAMLPLVEPISKKESLYTNALDKRDPTSIDKSVEMSSRKKN